MTFLLLLIGAVLLGFATYVRLAPSDPARWHVDPTVAVAPDLALSPLGEAARIVTTLNSAAARVEALGPQRASLARLDEIAMATPRTVRLAGSPEEGRITWVTRSAFWGFPDYITAQAMTHDVATSEVTVLARARFGSSDLGVNAARLKDWLSRL